MPMKRRFELIKSAGFDSVMIWWGNGTGNFEGEKFAYRLLAAKYDLYICNAHLPFDECNDLWSDASVGDEYVDFIFQNINSSKLGFCFDSGHNNFFTPDIDVLSKYKQHIFALHLDDNVGDADIHMLPFDGTTNWDRMIKTLKEIKYNGVLSLEVQQDRHEKYHGLSPENYLALAIERAERIEQGLKI